MTKKCTKCELNYVSEDETFCELCKDTKEQKNKCGLTKDKLKNFEISKYKHLFDIDINGYIEYLLLKNYKISTEKKGKSTVFDYKNTIKRFCKRENVDFEYLFNNVENILKKEYSTQINIISKLDATHTKQKHVLTQLQCFKYYIKDYQN